ncbi:hypothetical protein [Tabrizicola sp.]|uniref:hypothetical protein n=1 Tax=Tabrizicola sp. TaxID=2005166 RepID=UPI0026122FC0|nr:hypothetical protein [Tabrizicola sp.]MDM7932646.1 hypothetical protein [Tabrizicola sp.]
MKTIVLTGIVSCCTILLLVAVGLPPSNSGSFNHAWTIQYSEALSWTEPFPRNLPGLWAGFGGHDFFFYAPLPFWFVAVFVDPLCPRCGSTTEFAVGSSILLVASGFAMFAFLRRFFDSRPAAFGATFYVLMPYHLLLDWFLRQAAGEFAAYAFIPLVALGIDQIRKGERGTAALTLGVAGTALSHLPTTLLAAHVFGLLVLVLVARADGGWIGKLRLLAGFAWPAMLGLALASFYWLPAVVLLDTVSPHVLFDPYFEAWRWLYAYGAETPNEHFALTVSIAFLACAPLVLGSSLFARGPLLVWILVPTTLALFLNTAPSEPIWRNWIISKAQFPWRMMIFVDFAAGISAAVLLNSAASRVGRFVLSAALIAAVLPTAYLTKQVKLSMDQALPETQYHDGFAAIEYLSPEMNEALRRRLDLPELDHFDQGAVARSIADMATEFARTHPEVNILRTGTRSLTAVGPRDAKVMPLPVQYWSLWTASNSSGTALETRPNPVFGTLDIIAPAGGFDREPVHVSLRYRPSEVIGAVVSVLAMLVLLATSIRARRRKH